MINPQLQQAIQEEISLSREEGLNEGEIKWMAIGAGIRFGRDQGLIPDPTEPEWFAAVTAVVNEELKKG